MRVLKTIYYFVVGDPILLIGGLAIMALGFALRSVLGPWDGVLIFLGITAVLIASLRYRPE